LAQAINSTITDTPPTHLATLETGPAFGPRSARIDPTSARGRRSAVGGMLGCSARCASMLLRNACVRSAFAVSMETPGLRRAMTLSHPQL
jgi:hypothetical protein